ncbi:PP2C family protein-serine/threonine phosphatase [Delftia acidovorans]|uniref:PP2C family protein-serine/threonine phosphatase n=1 Tax=Delftia acidovorans TaxID=80866 RepID=UPI00333F26C2
MVARTDVGRRRDNNEDAVTIHPSAQPWPIAVLADGMGGYNAGEVASAMAISLVSVALQSVATETPAANTPQARQELQQSLANALNLANAAILTAAQKTPGCRGMGTTIITAALLPGLLMLAHLGDSRAYGWREGQLLRLTRDHTWLQEEIDAGRIQDHEARQSGLGHLLTQALGVTPDVTPDFNEWPLQPGDRILLCSDGLTDMLDDQAIAALFTQSSPLPVLLTSLLAAANEAGGNDNISAALIEIQASPPPTASTSLD